MNVLVDTSVWSLALRRRTPKAEGSTAELTELVQEGRVTMCGPVRQELLSGIKADAQLRTLRERLRAFPDLELESTDYEDAALCFNACRKKGVQGSNTDFLLCALALRHDLPIFTTDKDFEQYKKVLSLKLHEPRV